MKHLRIALISTVVLAVLGSGVLLLNIRPDSLQISDQPAQDPQGCPKDLHCVTPPKWPSFEATYQKKGDPIVSGGRVVYPDQVRKIHWSAPDNWMIEVIDSEQVQLSVGIWDPTGSWEKQEGRIYSRYRAVRQNEESRSLPPDNNMVADGFQPILVAALGWTEAQGAKVETVAEVCYLDTCTTDSMGLRVLERSAPSGNVITTDDVWRIPLQSGDFRVLRLQIHAERPVQSDTR